MVCWCTLAGTSACESCNRYKEYGFKSNKPNIVSIPYIVDNGSERRLQEIENAIKRLNERIDGLVELTQWMRSGDCGAVANSVQTPKGE